MSELIYRERPAAGDPAGLLVLHHGRGADEHDLLALGVLQSLVMIGRVSVPRDIALIGYDDIAFASAAVVPLSSVSQPSRAIGATAVDILLQEAADPGLKKRTVVFQPELVVRASTALS